MNTNNAMFEAAFGTAGQLPPSDLPEYCFSGRSNVGKSSLINKILNRKNFARVSSTPGKTATVNFYKVDNIRLVDLPGYGYAKVNRGEKQRWAELMESYFTTNRNIVLVFQLIDMRHDPAEFDVSMLRFLKEYGVPYAVILTKSDKLNKAEFQRQLDRITAILDDLAKDVKIIPFSALKGTGAEEIRELIE
ncbi:MAG TPA: YihA family ribosome biogenesis GTP-binding protein [Ruminococcaceae bacterium]|nr:YihA family ribosome biogenesis GTP-binding protein [Oscillospiraceae bacterium]